MLRASSRNCSLLLSSWRFAGCLGGYICGGFEGRGRLGLRGLWLLLRAQGGILLRFSLCLFFRSRFKGIGCRIFG